tara:strand:+ start:23 stop:442 length:420 start_codon:yes stop_codon:yes gene_type:complete
MKKIVFSLILLFGAVLFVPQNSFSQVRVKSRQDKSNSKIVVKKPNRNRGVLVNRRPTHQHSTSVVVSKPLRPDVIVKRPNRIRQNHIWVKGHWKWSNFYREYIWVKGKWIRERSGHYWVSGFWEVSLNGFIWVEGYWGR